MSKVTEEQEAALARLNVEYKAFRAFERAERQHLMDVLVETLARKVESRRAVIAAEATRLHREGVPAARLGRDVFETKAYVTYQSFLEAPEVAVTGTAEADFSPSGDDFIVTLKNWGPKHLSGTATFSRIEGEWMNTDTENEVGNYVEQSLFVNGDDKGLVERFSESPVSD